MRIDYDFLDDAFGRVWKHKFARVEFAGMMMMARKPHDQPDGTRHLIRVKPFPFKVGDSFEKVVVSDKRPIWKIIYNVQNARPYGERTYSLVDFEGDADQFRHDLVLVRTFL